MDRARVLLVEDHRAVADRLRDLLETEFEVVATASNGYELLGAARVLKPDVIVTDISMPGLDGLEASALVLAENPSARVVAISIHDDAAIIRRALEIGILGFVCKSGGCGDLIEVVKAALRGERTLLPSASVPPPGGIL